ncbi:MAG: transporter [Bacteroidetes bacterium]|nr:transporter [Bacteroidota bacterium]
MHIRNFTCLLSFFAFIVLIPLQSDAQGCVAIRGTASCGAGLSANLSSGEFQAGTGLRYFKSFRHFRGSEEEHHRIEEGTEVVNHSAFLDLQLNYGITDRLYAGAVIPFVYHSRSSMYEHGGNPPNGLGERHTTTAYGLSDIRLELGFWLFDPMKHSKFNYSLALGVKLPSGKYDYTDTFYNQGENRDEDIEAVVDQSIQPGDGGTGLTVNFSGYQQLSESLILNASLFYLFNFQETNGVLTRRGTSEFSCPDQYAARLGAFYSTNFHSLSAYLGGRLEGVPAQDLVGGSAGYRRPGYAVSVEPGISFDRPRYSLSLTVPVALVRNRTQSYQDKERTAETGEYRHGDAAFADYLINFNFAYRFGGKSDMESHDVMEWDDVDEN